VIDVALNVLAEKIKEVFGDQIVDVKLVGDKRLFVKVKRESVPKIARYMKDELGFDMPISSGGTDYPKKNVIELFWIVWSSEKNAVLILKTDVDREEPKIESLTGVWLGVQKFERETWELLGVEFLGHPKLKPLLLPEDWGEGFPLRKDFKLEPYRSPLCDGKYG
jgi:NADH-quinone oxidoreductase subunit C